MNLLSIQQEKKRDKGQIAFPLMGGGNGGVILQRCADVWHKSRFSQKRESENLNSE